VALTADATEEAGRRCEEAGMDACITKPIEPYRLLEIIGMVMRNTGKDRQPASKIRAVSSRLSAHPQNRTTAAAVVDLHTLNALENLGGRQFIDELARQFLDDAADVLHCLTEAAASGDLKAFREQLHALRSAAANIGARGIYEMCLAWRQIAPEDFASQGETYLKGLREEYERVRVALEEQFSKPNVAA